MTTSGSTDYALTGAQIVAAALEEIAVIGQGDSVATADETSALVQLNLMMKLDQAKGVKLWRYREAKLIVTASTASYSLPGATACDITELSETTLDADEAASQTVISVTSTSGFTNADTILIVLDDGTVHSSTIASFVTNDTVTIDDALASAASSGNKVFVYTNACPRPLKIVSMRTEYSSNETPIGLNGDPMSRSEYFNLPNKDSTGFPTQYYYDPQTPTGKLYLWPAPSSVDYEMNFTYLDSIEDIDTNTETADYPQEWLSYLVSNLAVRLAPSYGKQVQNETILWAQDSKEALMDWDIEETDIFF